MYPLAFATAVHLSAMLVRLSKSRIDSMAKLLVSEDSVTGKRFAAAWMQ